MNSVGKNKKSDENIAIKRERTMIDLILSLAGNGRYVSVYANPDDPSAFIYGRILAADGDNFVMYCISQDGEYDGLALKRTDSVSRIEVDGQYHAKMQKLIDKNLPEAEFEFTKDRLVQSVMEYTCRKGCVVSVEIQNSGYDDTEGFVSKTTEDYCVIKQVDVFGFSDGTAVVKYDSVTRISCDGITERRLERLSRINGGI